MSLLPGFFRDSIHESVFYILMKKCNRTDFETVPVMYLLALTGEEGSSEGSYNISRPLDGFDFNDMHIKPDSLKHGWHTSGSAAAFRLAFILWNGFPSERSQKKNNLYNIFGHGNDKYLLEAIRLRYIID